MDPGCSPLHQSLMQARHIAEPQRISTEVQDLYNAWGRGVNRLTRGSVGEGIDGRPGPPRPGFASDLHVHGRRPEASIRNTRFCVPDFFLRRLLLSPRPDTNLGG